MDTKRILDGSDDDVVYLNGIAHPAGGSKSNGNIKCLFCDAGFPYVCPECGGLLHMDTGIVSGLDIFNKIIKCDKCDIVITQKLAGLRPKK